MPVIYYKKTVKANQQSIDPILILLQTQLQADLSIVRKLWEMTYSFLQNPPPKFASFAVIQKFTYFFLSFIAENNMVMLFSVTEMKNILGLDRMVSQAELRLLIRNPSIPLASEQRLELYQGVGDEARYLNSHTITNKFKDKWISFDVTQTVKNWLLSSGELI